MSYEKEMMEKLKRGEDLNDKIDIPILKYLWNASPLSVFAKENYHQFFKKISILNSFSDNEIRLFTKFLHQREFQTNEVIFNQGDSGYGMYFIFSGAVNIYANYDPQTEGNGDFVIRLEEKDFFGEMGLLEEFNRRSATIIAARPTTLLGIFKPDLDQILELHPVLGAKLVRETALILANRLGQLTREISNLKMKVKELEQKL